MAGLAPAQAGSLLPGFMTALVSQARIAALPTTTGRTPRYSVLVQARARRRRIIGLLGRRCTKGDLAGRPPRQPGCALFPRRSTAGPRFDFWVQPVRWRFIAGFGAVHWRTGAVPLAIRSYRPGAAPGRAQTNTPHAIAPAMDWRFWARHTAAQLAELIQRTTLKYCGYVPLPTPETVANGAGTVSWGCFGRSKPGGIAFTPGWRNFWVLGRQILRRLPSRFPLLLFSAADSRLASGLRSALFIRDNRLQA